MKRANPKALVALSLAALGLHACSRAPDSGRAAAEAALAKDPAVVALRAKPGQDVSFTAEVSSKRLTTEKFQHTVNGVKVLGSGVSYHSAGALTNHLAAVEISTEPALSAELALALAQKLTAGTVQAPATLAIYPTKKKTRLIYQIDTNADEQIWLDANTGEHVATLSARESVAVEVHSAAKQGIMASPAPGDKNPGGCRITDLATSHIEDVSKDECDTRRLAACQVLAFTLQLLSVNADACALAAPEDESAARARANTERFLKYFEFNFHRLSYDGLGAPVKSVVHAGMSFGNAFWNRETKSMLYGDGNGVTTRDFTYAVDIAGHELTHGVIQSASGLLGIAESGALNESLADFFGKMVETNGEPTNWGIGGSVLLPLNPDNAIRDLATPGRLQGGFMDTLGDIQHKPYPATRAEEAPILESCSSVNDVCSVHYNSTIPGHAWYSIYQKLGKEKSQALIYLALTHYFHETTDFAGAATGTLAACAVSLPAADCAAVKEIFTANGMLE